MDVLERYTRVKKQVENLQREHDRAEGILSECLGRLQEKFGVDSLKAANQLLKKLEEQGQQREQKFEQELAHFEEQYGQFID